MKKILMAVIMMGMADGASTAGVSDLGVNASNLKAQFAEAALADYGEILNTMGVDDVKAFLVSLPVPVPSLVAKAVPITAANVSLDGDYSGKTARGGADCGVKITRKYDSMYIQFGWDDNTGRYMSCGFFPKKTSSSGNLIEFSGGSESSVCKAQLTLNANSVPVSAKFGVGSFVQLGYDVTCLNLKRN